jgi:hypothetical protein
MKTLETMRRAMVIIAASYSAAPQTAITRLIGLCLFRTTAMAAVHD